MLYFFKYEKRPCKGNHSIKEVAGNIMVDSNRIGNVVKFFDIILKLSPLKQSPVKAANKFLKTDLSKFNISSSL
jgi:hypothetical protein